MTDKLKHDASWALRELERLQQVFKGLSKNEEDLATFKESIKKLRAYLVATGAIKNVF